MSAICKNWWAEPTLLSVFAFTGNQIGIGLPRRAILGSDEAFDRDFRHRLLGEWSAGHDGVDVVADAPRVVITEAAIRALAEFDVGVAVKDALAGAVVVVGVGLGELEGRGVVGGGGDVAAAGFAGILVGHEREVGREVAVLVDLVAGEGAEGRGVG